jgi:nitroimidazol reductase NimA-like FMN-containing flavoprotein (pyridoxamine 5'-phosphate oxidase superfamily)
MIDPESPQAELETLVHDVIDDNRYLVLGTVEPDGGPRLSPVYFTHDDYRTFYWVSSPQAQHSRNVATHPAVTAVVFDSSIPPAGHPQAVYLSATAHEVPAAELAAACEVAFRRVGGGVRPFTPDELSAPADLRLYRASATSYAVHIRGSHPSLGTGVDTRLPVVLRDNAG